MAWNFRRVAEVALDAQRKAAEEEEAVTAPAPRGHLLPRIPKEKPKKTGFGSGFFKNIAKGPDSGGSVRPLRDSVRVRPRGIIDAEAEEE
jgi:hypothetical protein